MFVERNPGLLVGVYLEDDSNLELGRDRNMVKEEPFAEYTGLWSEAVGSAGKIDYVKLLVNRLQSSAFGNFEVTWAEKISDHGANSIAEYWKNEHGVEAVPIPFSALIHDTDHQGVPNAQLVKEGVPIAAKYKDRSVAEQNSVDLAWALFMDPKYTELRQTIAQTTDEISRFRQLVINCVMATDIVDKELKQLRNGRWEKAFSGEVLQTEEAVNAAVNRKATIVIEHIIQASDIAHTMQQWHVYRKWNQRFFLECYRAFKMGRAEKDPSKYWYDGEIGFFDFYIIPLARKLKESGVFGQYGDEYVKTQIEGIWCFWPIW